jgi:protein-S-isoprenylcysteine O-methyltransferase Ste14
MLIMPIFSTNQETILFSSAIGLWILSEIIGGVIIPMLRRRGGTKSRKDDRSTLSNNVLRVSLYVSIVIAIFLSINNIAMLPDWLFYPGIILIVIGVIVRQWAMFILGRFFILAISAQKDQKVVDHGPYRFIRHPSYLGMSLTVIGIGIALRSWGGILVILVIYGLALGYRVYVEEKFLALELGDDYIQYMKKTKRLIPFVL